MKTERKKISLNKAAIQVYNFVEQRPTIKLAAVVGVVALLMTGCATLEEGCRSTNGC